METKRARAVADAILQQAEGADGLFLGAPEAGKRLPPGFLGSLAAVADGEFVDAPPECAAFPGEPPFPAGNRGAPWLKVRVSGPDYTGVNERAVGRVVEERAALAAEAAVACAAAAPAEEPKTRAELLEVDP